MGIVKRHNLKLWLVSLAITFSGTAIASPFGVAMGTKVSQLEIQRDLGDGLLAVRPPTPNPNLARYYVYATQKHGVCNVSAGSKFFTDAATAMSLHLEIATSLDLKYGPSTLRRVESGTPSFDNFIGKSQFDEHELYWDSILPDEIRRITLKLRQSREGVSVTLKYSYNNETACYLWIPEEDGTGL